MDCKAYARGFGILLALWGSICLVKGRLWQDAYLLGGRWVVFLRRLIVGFNEFTTNLPMWNDLYVGLGCIIIAVALQLKPSWICSLFY